MARNKTIKYLLSPLVVQNLSLSGFLKCDSFSSNYPGYPTKIVDTQEI
jgi:hypothetical protein